METNPKLSLEKDKDNALSIIEPSELSDICINKGILQEVNRTFFNPLGFVLQLDEKTGGLGLFKHPWPEGPVINTINKMQHSAYMRYAQEKNSDRQRFYGFIIQVADIIRGDTIKETIASPQQQRLSILLQALDFANYQCKALIMAQSKTKDQYKANFPYAEELLDKAHHFLTVGKIMDAINFLVFAEYHSQIKGELEKIKGGVDEV